jgi:hypothetical protein
VASDSPKDPASQEPVEIWIVDEQAAKEKRNKTIVLNLAKKMEDPPVLENPPPVDETNNEAPDPGAFTREEEERLRVMRWQHQEEIRKTVGRRRERRARQNQLRSLIQGGR